MASFTKLVFISALLSLGSAAPLRAVRPRQTAPASDSSTSFWAAPLTLQAQHDSFNFDLASSLNTPSSTVTPTSTVPSNCANYNSLSGECPTYFETVDVTYDDCGDAWKVCRCSTANMTMDTVVERLGRVPVGLRRYVATVVVSPDDTTHAYTLTSGDIHMFGDTAEDTWVHESLHAFDWASGTPISHTAEWMDTIKSDLCVPDTYSTTSAIEDFAQVGVLKLYSLANNNTLPAGWSSDCMSNQLKFMDHFSMFNSASLFGPTCAIQSSDPGARHTAPPTQARVQPGPPLTPLAAVPAGALPAESAGIKNAALATAMLGRWGYAPLGVGIVGWLSW